MVCFWPDDGGDIANWISRIKIEQAILRNDDKAHYNRLIGFYLTSRWGAWAGMPLLNTTQSTANQHNYRAFIELIYCEQLRLRYPIENSVLISCNAIKFSWVFFSSIIFRRIHHRQCVVAKFTFFSMSMSIPIKCNFEESKIA